MADRARDPETLEREIERTRAELQRAIDALADRANPRNMARRGMTRLKEETGQAVAVVGSVFAPTDGDELGADRRTALIAGAGVALTVTVAIVVWRRRRR